MLAVVKSGVEFLYTGNALSEQLAKLRVAQEGMDNLIDALPFNPSDEGLKLVDLVGLILRSTVYGDRETWVTVFAEGNLPGRQPI